MNDHLLSRFLIVLTSISACAGDSNVTLTSTSLIPSTRPSRQLASHLNEFCATGIVSLHAKYTRHLCCGAQCGSCGSSQEDCAKRGESECCVESIISKWRSCVGPNDTGCIIPLDLCRYGIKSDDGILCCGGACEECGDAHRGCAKKTGGSSQCCKRDIIKSRIQCSRPADTACLLPKPATKIGDNKYERKDKNKDEKTLKLKDEGRPVVREKVQHSVAGHIHSSTPSPSTFMVKKKLLESRQKINRQGTHEVASAQCVAMSDYYPLQIPGPSVTISIHLVSTVSECCEACGATPSCVAFLVDKSSTPQYQCYLKSDTCDGAPPISFHQKNRFVSGLLLEGVNTRLQPLQSNHGYGSLVKPDDVVSGEANISSRITKLLLPSLPPLPQQGVITVFLDHGGVVWHAEVFYAVAKMLERKYWASHKSRTKFLIEGHFAKKSGLAVFWDRFVKDLDYLILPKVAYKLRDIHMYRISRAIRLDTPVTFSGYRMEDRQLWKNYSVQVTLQKALEEGASIHDFYQDLSKGRLSIADGEGDNKKDASAAAGSTSIGDDVIGFQNIAKCPESTSIDSWTFKMSPRTAEYGSFAYRPLVYREKPQCNRDFASLVENGLSGVQSSFAYDVRAVVTNPKFYAPNAKEFDQFTCLSTFRNHERFVFILHYPSAPLLSWSNVYIATNARAAQLLTPRHFTPDEMPVESVPPDCLRPPVFVVQGSLGRRVTKLLPLLASDEGVRYIGSEFTLRIITRSSLEGIIDEKNKRLDYREHLDMLSFAVAPLGAAFLLPLISPTDEGTAHYFRGHPSSNIAFAKHYDLRIIGHSQLTAAYYDDLKCRAGHYYDNESDESFLDAAKRAIDALKAWCQKPVELRKPWHQKDSEDASQSC